MYTNIDERETDDKFKSPLFSDLDGTIITFDKTDKNKISYIKSAIDTIIAYGKENRKIIIVSNQKHLNDEIRGKIIKILKKLREYAIIDFYASTSDDWYRKPSPKIFEEYILKFGAVGKTFHYVFIGDAAGRPGDFSNSDRIFSYNCNLLANFYEKGSVEFSTPEATFLNQTKEKLPTITDNSLYGLISLKSRVDAKSDLRDDLANSFSEIESVDKLLIVLVGLPGAGKSYLANCIYDYIRECDEDKGDFSAIIISTESGKYEHRTHTKTADIPKYLKKQMQKESLYSKIIVDSTAYNKSKRSAIGDIFTNTEYKKILIDVNADTKFVNAMRFYRTNLDNITVPLIGIRTLQKRYESPEIEDYDYLYHFDMSNYFDISSMTPYEQMISKYIH